MKSGRDKVFVDTGAWLALALTRDPYHEQAKLAWSDPEFCHSALVTSVPIVVETFTFLDRNASRETAFRWRNEVTTMRRLQVVDGTQADLAKCWDWFEVKGIHRLTVVDAMSFVIMKRLKIRRAFAYDQHFAQAGFEIIA